MVGIGLRERKRRGEAGQSVIEVTLMAPWLFLLFMGVFNVGIYAYSLISVENALRVAAHRASASQEAANKGLAPCNAMVSEMRALPNVNVLDCVGACTPQLAGEQCNVGPLRLTLFALDDANSADGESPAVLMTIRYDGLRLFSIPGLSGLFRFERRVQMRVRE